MRKLKFELMRIVGADNRILANSIATTEDIWHAHRNVYESIGKSDWAQAIYKAYVKPLGIDY